MRYFGKIKSEKRRASGSKTRNPQSPDGVIRQTQTAFYGKIGARKTTKTDGYKRQFSAAESDKKLLQKIDKKLRHNPTFFAADSDKISPAYSDKNRDMRGCFIVNFRRIKVRYQPTCRRPCLFLRSKKR